MFKSNADSQPDSRPDSREECRPGEDDNLDDEPATPRLTPPLPPVHTQSEVETVRPPSLLGRLPPERADAETLPPPPAYVRIARLLPDPIAEKVSADLSTDPRSADSD